MTDETRPNENAELQGDDLGAVERLRDAFASLKAEMAKVIVGQQNVLHDLRPRIPPRRQPPSPPEGALLGRMRLQGREQAEKFLRVLSLQNQGIVARHRIIFPGTAGTGHPPHRHGFQPYQSERLMSAIGQHGAGGVEEDLSRR